MRQLYRLWPTVCVALAPGLASASVSTSCAASAMDVVVVGGGLAGLCATIEATRDDPDDGGTGQMTRTSFDKSLAGT